MTLLVLHRDHSVDLALAGDVIQRKAFASISGADQLLKEVRAVADAMLAEARETASQVHREAWEQGLREGREAGIEVVLGTLETERRARELLAARLGEIVEQCVRSMLGEIGSADVFRKRVTSLVRSTPPSAGTRLHVCAWQAPLAREALADLQRELATDLQWIDVVGDDQREPDSLMLETRLGFVDASIEMTLEAARELIRRAVLRAAGGTPT